jgi:hypothetical protein
VSQSSRICLWRVLAVVAAAIVCPSAYADLNEITQCVEVTWGTASTSETVMSWSIRCDPNAALQRARGYSREHARDRIAPTCQSSIDAAEAQATCSSHGLYYPTGSSTAMSSPPVAAPDSPISRVDASLPIGPRLCAILRNVSPTGTAYLPADFDHGWCVFNNRIMTKKTVLSNAKCGVQCNARSACPAGHTPCGEYCCVDPPKPHY